MTKKFCNQKEEVYVSLHGTTLQAKLGIDRMTQEEPHKGDEIRVSATIYLPSYRISAGSSARLDNALQFGNRVSLFNEELVEMWGSSHSEEPWRLKSEIVKAKTWKKAFSDARLLLCRELRKLTIALESRSTALKEAELDDEETDETMPNSQNDGETEK